MLLSLGDSGAQVARLIADLRTLGFQLPAGQVFDAVVKKTVEAFQVTALDAAGVPLLVDGKVGIHTRWALDAALHATPPGPTSFDLPPPIAGGSATGRAALAVALQEMAAGHGEIGGDNRGPQVATYLHGLSGPTSWCAAFVSYCFYTGRGGQNAVFGYQLGAQDVHNRMRALGHAYAASLTTPPQPGDLIAWRRVDPSDPNGTAWRGHIGLVYGYADGNLWTVEGNRGSYPSKVKPFRYSWSALVASATNDKFKGLYGVSRHP